MTKTIETLVADINHVLTTGEGMTDEIMEWIGNDIVQSLHRQFKRIGLDKPGLRISQLGTPCERKLWYSINQPDRGEPLPPDAKFKFVFGDLIESALLGLAKAAGHSVEGLQTRLEIEGVNGHRDCIIDGVLVDVKSSSTYSFGKFRDGGLRGDDPFGYLSQLSSYLFASQDDPLLKVKDRAGFLVADKTLGKIIYSEYDLSKELSNKREEVLRKKKLVKSKSAPDRAYDDEEMGKSGNRKLGIACSYCGFKNECWPGLRTFLYSNGPVFLTEVVSEPNVWEIR